MPVDNELAVIVRVYVLVQVEQVNIFILIYCRLMNLIIFTIRFFPNVLSLLFI